MYFFFCLLLMIALPALISLGRSKSHGQAENQGSEKKIRLFAKLQNNGHSSREGWRIGVDNLRWPQEPVLPPEGASPGEQLPPGLRVMPANLAFHNDVL